MPPPRRRLIHMRIYKHWYAKSPLTLLLTPLSWLYCLAVMVRRGLYRLGIFKSRNVDVPVVVVGNITVGGTGKTPLVIWLVQLLREAGYQPGVASRGYGGEAQRWPQQVRVDSDPDMVGDEPVLIARRCRCPVAVAPDRVTAAESLVEHAYCDIIVCDDGLQHYALKRDVEIVVIDDVRRFGNGHCLPAGPLREPPRRLKQADYVVANGLAGAGEIAMRLAPGVFRNLADEQLTADREMFKGRRLHAVAGIGHPARFFTQLRGLGLDVKEHAFPDHYRFHAGDLDFGDDMPVVMTEKDAVKCRRFALPHHWYLPVDARLDEEFTHMLLERIKSLVG